MRSAVRAPWRLGAPRVSTASIGAIVWAAMFGGCADDPVVPPATSTVVGRIVDTTGSPVAGVVVLVGDKPAATSDAEGAVRFEGVGATYDATVLGPARVDLFKGLTRRDPVFRVGEPESTRAARVRGTVPVAADKVTRVVIIPDYVFGRLFANPVTGGFDIPARWPGPSRTFAGTVFVVRYTVGTDGLPVEYDGFASRDLVLVHGETATLDFAPEDLSDPEEAKISGAVAVPSAYELDAISIRMVPRGGAFALFAEVRRLQPGSTFEYTVPRLDDTSFEIEAFALDGGHHTVGHQRGIVPPATAIHLDLPPAPRIIQPAPDATDVGYETLFQWEEGGGTGVYALFLRWRPEFSIWLTGTSTTIPNLTEHGLGLVPGANYEWVVNKVFPLASVDDVVGPEPWHQVVGPRSGEAHSMYSQFTVSQE